MKKVIKCDDGITRCSWCGSKKDYIAYHDTEWGFPVVDDFKLFEKISLEAFQAGLSWYTILRKRENFRTAFDNFDFNKIAKFSAYKTHSLLKNKGIVRHRGKIEATIHNAKCAKNLVVNKGSLANFFWRFAPEKPVKKSDSLTMSEESNHLSDALKKQGWKFVGPTTCYAFMQAMGMVNDHAKECDFYQKACEARQSFRYCS